MNRNVQEAQPCQFSILVRDKAVLVCLEGLRLIIAQHKALILSVPSDSLQAGAPPFSDSTHIRDLVSRLRICVYVDGYCTYLPATPFVCAFLYPDQAILALS